MRKLFLLLIGISLLASTAEARTVKLNDKQVEVAKTLVKELRENYPEEDPLEYVAMAWVETRLTLTAISRSGDYGLLQVNHKIHKKKLKKSLGITSAKQLLNLKNNIDASVMIVRIMRKKYRQCRKTKLYSCYNGGPGWKRVQDRCLSECSGKGCRRCNRAFRYGKLVKRVKRYLKKRHGTLFDAPENGGMKRD